MHNDRQTPIVGSANMLTFSKAHYHSAYIAMLVGYSVKLVMVIVLYIYMYRSNKARDAAGLSDDKTAVEMGMLDQTELDNPGFRWVFSVLPTSFLTVLTRSRYAL